MWLPKSIRGVAEASSHSLRSTQRFHGEVAWTEQTWSCRKGQQRGRGPSSELEWWAAAWGGSSTGTLSCPATPHSQFLTCKCLM